MFWLTVIFAVAALLLFLRAGIWPEKPQKFGLVALGLACLTVAWSVQLIFLGPGGRLIVR